MTLDERYFRDLYAANPDPWNFVDSQYEASKYEATIESFGGRVYDHALEVGCSIGVLTERLREHAQRLTAIDIADQPLREARARNAAARNITFIKAAFPGEAPPGPFDLILLSEVLYYLSPPDLDRAAQVVLNRLAPAGDVVLVHWLGPTDDYPMTGDQAAEGFIRLTESALTTVRQTRREKYRLDVLRRGDSGR